MRWTVQRLTTEHWSRLANVGADGDDCVTPPPAGQGAASPGQPGLPLVNAPQFARLMEEVLSQFPAPHLSGWFTGMSLLAS